MTTSRPPAGDDARDLRERALERLRLRREHEAPRAPADALRLVHELEVHQVELEIQKAELERTRDELASSLARYTDLYDFAPVGYLSLDRDGTILSVNLYGADLLGVPRARLLGRRLGDFVPPSWRPALVSFLARTLAGSSREACELALQPEGGWERVVRIESTSSPSGLECRAAVTDVTERRVAEDALAREHLLLSEAEQVGHLGSWEWDVGLDEFRVSPEWRRIHGTSEHVLSRRALSGFAHPEDVSRVMAALEDALAGPRPYDVEHRIVRADDGRVRLVHALAFVERDAKGRPLRAVGVAQDVTDSREAERALRESEKEKRLLLEHLPIGVVAHGPDTRILYSNPKAAELLGLSASAMKGKAAVGSEWRFLRDDGSAMPAREFPVNAVLATGRPLQGLVLGICPPKSDATTWVLVQAYPELGNDGRLRQVVVVFVDVTARRREQAAVREQEERYRALFDTASDAITIHDLETGRILDANPAANRLYGWPPEELRTLRFDDLAAGEDAGSCPLAGLPGHGVLPHHRRKDGTVFPVELRTSAFDVGGRPAMAVFARDISERVEAEARLRASEDQFRRAVSEAPIPILIHDEDDRNLQVSSGWARFSGYTLDDIPTMGDWTEKAYGSRSGLEKKYIDALFSIDATVSNGEWRVTTKDGLQRTWEFQTTPLGRSPAGRRVLMSLAVDVTEKKAAEDGIRRANAGLEEAVRERTLELAEANASLAEANAELEAFVQSVSHDLRAPVRAISGFAQVLAEDFGERLSPEGTDYLGRIRAAGQRMGTLIDDLLRLSRIGRADLELSNVDLAGPCREILAELAAGSPERPVETVVPGPILVHGDDRLLRVLLENLLGNAWKFTAATRGARIEVGCEIGPEGFVDVFVRDNGAGFDPDLKGKLFRPFQRLHSADQFPGSGIGLAIVERIARRLGGSARAEGAAGAGATFHVLLPVAKEGAS